MIQNLNIKNSIKYNKKNILNSINNINILKKLIKINNLVISGGGLKGLTFIGVIKYIEELKIIDNIKNFYGCSVGGLITSLIILGYKSDELINFIINFDFMILIKPNINQLILNYSLGNIDNYILMLKNFIKNKNFNPEITLLEFYKITNKTLHLIGFNFTTQKETIFNYITFPNIELWKAIYITSALPTLFPPLLYNNDYYFDGGITNNNPINLIHQSELSNTIGITCAIYKSSNNNINNIIHNKNIYNYIKFMSEVLLISFDKENYHKNNQYNNIITVECDNDIFDFIDFSIDKIDKINKILIGYNFCKKLLPNIFEHLINIHKINNSSEQFNDYY